MFDILLLGCDVMYTENVNNKEKINNCDWIDLTLKQIEQVEDKTKRKEYKKQIREFLINIINPLAMSVPRSFKFSVNDEELTYQQMLDDYVKYFYTKGKSREDIVKIIKDKLNNNHRIKK